MAIRYSEIYPEINGALQFDVDRVLFFEQSPFQKVEIYDTPGFGKVLVIDGFVMLTEKDEFVYHEMIAHTPLFVHPEPKQVLIIGGGDGGTARECLRHVNVEHVDLVDIDETVSRACLEFMPGVASQLLSERITCRFEDGVAYVKNCQKKYDIIIIDSTDPISVGEGLFTPEFYQGCYDLLADDGILVNQSESPSWQPELVQQINRKLKKIFPQVYFYQAHIPTYPSGHWAFGFSSKKYHPVKDFHKAHYASANLRCKYYNQEIHTAAFALPNFVRELIDAV